MHAAGDEKAGGEARLSPIPISVRLRSTLKHLRTIRCPARVDVRTWVAREFETEAKARSAFFLIPVAMMIGIALVDGAGLRIGLLPAATAAIPLLLLAGRLGGRGLFGASVLVLAFALAGMVLALAEIGWTKTTLFSGEATVRIEGRVLWRDRDDRNRMRYLVRILRTERPVLSRPPETASILVASRHQAIPVGGRFAGLVRLRAPSGPAYPGAYDFAFAPFFDGRGANGFALGPPSAPGPEVIDPTIGERLVRLRLAMSDRIRDVVGGGAGAVASALITGERSGIPDDIDNALRVTGLSHVLSISGLHMALVAGFAMFLVRGMLAAIPYAALTLPTKKIAAVAALVVSTAYLVISGSDVATDRSYVMLAIMLVAILVDRPALTLRNVAIAAIVVMLTTPHAVVTASFQMSFSATAALVGVYGAISRHRAKRSEKADARSGRLVAVLVFLGSLAASSLIAGSATAPYAAYHFQRIAPYGVIANLIAVPIFSFWIMPLALVAALAMPFGLDAPFLHLIGWALDLVFAMAKGLAAHFPDAASGRLTPAGLIVVSAGLLIGCLCASRLRWGAVPVLALGIVLLPDRNRPPELLIYEDGRELALIDDAGRLQSLRARPNAFVFDQWTRAYGTPGSTVLSANTKHTRRSTPGSSPRDDRVENMDLRSSDAEAVSSKGLSIEPMLAKEWEERAIRSPTRTERTRVAQASDTMSHVSAAFTCQQSVMPSGDALTRPREILSLSSTSPVSALTSSGVQNSRPHINQRLAVTDAPISKGETDHSATATQPSQPNAGSENAERSEQTARLASKTPTRRPPPDRQICRARTRSGLRIAWTDDYRLLGLVCDTADIAIVARAVALRTCRSGAHLITLRTLRESGSLAVSHDPATKRVIIERSIDDPDQAWNRHRRAPWPESWQDSDRSVGVLQPAVAAPSADALTRPMP